MRRRDFLALSAALPMASLACRRKGFPFEGALVEPAMELGHRFRDGGFPEPTSFDPVDAVIVGGGVAGLSAAWRFQGAGFTDFTLLEMTPEPGGTSRCGRNGIGTFPWGAHRLPAPGRDMAPMLRLLKECGVLQGFDGRGEPLFGEPFLARAPRQRVFAWGQWWEGLDVQAGTTEEDRRQRGAFFAEIERWRAFRDDRGRPAFAVPRARASDAAEVQSLDRASFQQWLDRRGFTSERLRWLLDYVCRARYGSRLETTSAWAGLAAFASEGPEHPTLTWPEGNGFLVGHLQKSVRERIRTNHVVTSIHHATPELIHVGAWDAAAQRPVGFQARRVIYAAPMQAVSYIVPSLWEARPEGFTGFLQDSWLVANLTLRSRPKEHGFPPSWENTIRDGLGLGYVAATHQALRDHGPALWTWYHALAAPEIRTDWKRLQAMDWKACARLVVDDLKRAHPDIERHIARLDVQRWAHAMVRPKPGFLFSEALRRAREPFEGLHFAHTDLSGIARFEEAQDHGLRAAEEVLAALGRPSSTWR